MKELHERKHPRLKGYDYSRAGGYFITFCTKNRENLLGEVWVGRDDLGAPKEVRAGPKVKLSPYGAYLDECIQTIPAAYPNVTDLKYVIMPNHVHLALFVDETNLGAPGSSRPTQLIPRIISALKRFTNRRAGQNLWQRSYYDHIIRNESDYLRIWEYIDANPAQWAEDEYCPGPQEREDHL